MVTSKLDGARCTITDTILNLKESSLGADSYIPQYVLV